MTQPLDQDLTAPHVFGFRIGGTRQTQFCALAFGVEGFHFSGWMTFLTYVFFVCCSLVERFFTGDMERKAPLKDYAMVSLAGVTGVYLTNWALQYLAYTVRVVFKSCKVIPVMMFGTVLQGRKYSREEYSAGLLLVFGISVFTAAGKSGASSFSWLGVVFISIALVCDAATSNLEERLFFRNAGSSQAEVVMFMSVFGLVYSGVLLVLTGEAWEAIPHSMQHPEVLPLIGAFSVMGYMSVAFVLLLIKHFTATNAEIVKSMRKVLQVSVSFIVYPKPFDWKYVAGGLATGAALYWFSHIKRSTKMRRGTSEEMAPHPTGSGPSHVDTEQGTMSQMPQNGARSTAVTPRSPDRGRQRLAFVFTGPTEEKK